jgi:hypothetical protein
MNWTPRSDIDRFSHKGAALVCNVPAPLGRVTALTVRNGKLVAKTESGISMIVHKPRR